MYLMLFVALQRRLVELGLARVFRSSVCQVGEFPAEIDFLRNLRYFLTVWASSALGFVVDLAALIELIGLHIDFCFIFTLEIASILQNAWFWNDNFQFRSVFMLNVRNLHLERSLRGGPSIQSSFEGLSSFSQTASRARVSLVVLLVLWSILNFHWPEILNFQ